jgi:hypothetical protein
VAEPTTATAAELAGRTPTRAWGTAMAQLGAVVLDKLPGARLADKLDAVADLCVREWQERGAALSDAAVRELAVDVASLTCAVVLAWPDHEAAQEAALTEAPAG